MENERLNNLVWNYYEPYQSVIALIDGAFDPFGYDEAIGEGLTAEELSEDENYDNLDPEVYRALTITSENTAVQVPTVDFKVYSEQVKIMEMDNDFTYALVDSEQQIMELSDSLEELVNSPEFLDEVKLSEPELAEELVKGFGAIVKEALSETQTFIEDGWEVDNDPYRYIESAEALLLENILTEENKKYYAVYDTQFNDFRTLGVYQTGEEAMEAGADHFVNVLDPATYEEMGGEAHFDYSTPQEDGELLGFTAVEINAKEAAWLEQASKTHSSIYYHESFMGLGETYQKFSSISRERLDIFGLELRTGKKAEETSRADISKLSKVFLEHALAYLRVNGELSVEERQEVEQKGTPVTPRTLQELGLLLLKGWFHDLYDVFDDELSYFNGVNHTELTRLDIESEISKYLEEYPFRLDFPTLYSLAQKGGKIGFTAPESAIDGAMDFTDDEVVGKIFERLIHEQGVGSELEQLGIFNVSQFQNALLTTQKEKQKVQEIEITLTRLSMIQEIKALKKLASGNNEVLSVGGGLLDEDLSLQIVKDYQKKYPEVVELEDDSARLGFSKVNAHKASDFILFNYNRPQSVAYVGDDFEKLLDVIQKNIPGVIPEIRQEWSQQLHEIFDFNQETLDRVQDWMMDHLEFTEHYQESVDIPLVFSGGRFEGPDDASSIRAYLEDSTDYWVDYEGNIAEIDYEPAELAKLEDHGMSFEGIRETLKAVDLTFGKVVEMIEAEKKMSLDEPIVKNDVSQVDSIGYYQKVVDQTIRATGRVQGIDIEKLDYFEKQVLGNFDIPRLTENELVALTLNLIHQVNQTTHFINEMGTDDPERQDYMSDYENEQGSYALLAQEWEARGVNVPIRAASFDANETEVSEPVAYYFEELLSDYLVKGALNFKEALPLPPKENHSSIHLK